MNCRKLIRFFDVNADGLQSRPSPVQIRPLACFCGAQALRRMFHQPESVGTHRRYGSTDSGNPYRHDQLATRDKRELVPTFNHGT